MSIGMWRRRGGGGGEENWHSGGGGGGGRRRGGGGTRWVQARFFLVMPISELFTTTRLSDVAKRRRRVGGGVLQYVS